MGEDLKNNEAPKVYSRTDALGLMAESDRLAVQEALDHLEASKNAAITTLTSNPKNKLTVDFLKAQSMDVLDQLDTKIQVSDKLKTMDARIFQDKPMGIGK